MENIAQDMQAIWSTEVKELEDGALVLMQKFLKRNGIKPESDLLNNLQQEVSIIAKDLYAEIKITFPIEGRFIDLKYVQYQKNRLPDPEGKLVEGFKKFIQDQGGLSKFPYIPGYTKSSKALPISTNAINRLAYALARARINKERINRRGAGWYNNSRSIFVQNIKSTLTQRIAQKITERVANNLQS